MPVSGARARPAAPPAPALAPALVLALAACGASRPPPRPPAPPDPRAVAQRLHLAMNEMAAIVARQRADCPRMAAALRELFGRMRLAVDEARRMAEDPALGKQLTAELRAYDDADRGLSDAIFRNLVACKDHRAVQDAMAAMPVVPAP
jgi:hypothetical protein